MPPEPANCTWWPPFATRKWHPKGEEMVPVPLGPALTPAALSGQIGVSSIGRKSSAFKAGEQ